MSSVYKVFELKSIYMKKVIIFIFLVIMFSNNSFSQTKSYAGEIVNNLMQSWKEIPIEQQDAELIDKCIILNGIEGLWKATANGSYFDIIQKQVDLIVDDSGIILSNKIKEYANISDLGTSILMLYQVTNKEKYLRALKSVYDILKIQQVANQGKPNNFKKPTDLIVHENLIYSAPFFAEYAKTFHDNDEFNFITGQLILTGRKIVGSNKTIKPQHGNFSTFLLAMYGTSLVDALEYFPPNYHNSNVLLKILTQCAVKVGNCQNHETGLWSKSVMEAGNKKYYPDLTISSMFVYLLAKSMRLGYLPSSYLPIAKKGYASLIKNFIRSDLTGKIKLYAYSLPALSNKGYGFKNSNPTIKEKNILNEYKSMGAFIRASNEMEMLPTLSLGIGKTVLLDNFFNHETRKDITGKIVPFHYIWEERDINGYSMFAEVFHKYGVKTKTLEYAPTLQNLKNADIYLIVDPDTEKESTHPNFIKKKDIEVIFDWVKGGGVLLIFGNDTGNVEFEHLNQLAAKFGFQFNYDSQNKVTGNNFEMGALKVASDHHIFKTAKKIYIKEYASQNIIRNTKPIFINDNLVVMSVTKIGKGTVFAVGDPWFYNEYTDGRKLPPDFENYKAAEDLVKWVIKQTKYNH